jgi:hypothetical protein
MIKMGWATFLAIFSQTHLVTLVGVKLGKSDKRKVSARRITRQLQQGDHMMVFRKVAQRVTQSSLLFLYI